MFLSNYEVIMLYIPGLDSGIGLHMIERSNILYYIILDYFQIDVKARMNVGMFLKVVL